MFRYQEEFFGQLYGRRVLLPQTPSAATDPNRHARPLVFQIAQSRTSRIRGRGRPVRATLVFFDSAGQDVTMGADMERYLRYLKYSAGIVYAIDPTQLAAAEADVNADATSQSAQATRSARLIIHDATKMLRASAGDKPIDKPAAVVLTKADMIKEAVADSSPLIRPDPAAGPRSWRSGRHP